MIKANNKDNKAQAEQTDVLANELGAYGLKSVGGSLSLGVGAYDSLTKIFFNAPKPVTGILKLFSLPPVTLRPESWVPATVATYQTISWDLDNLFAAVDDLVNKFQPGMINLVQQQLVGPDGGQPLDFKADIFGPLGNRISVITDYKKPIKEDSQRTLMAIALEIQRRFRARSPGSADRGCCPRETRIPGDHDLRLQREPPRGSPGKRRGTQGPDQRRDRQGRALCDHRRDLA